MRSLRVVLAEDDEATQKIVKDFLHDLGCEVIAFQSGQAAWDHLAGSCPDCLLLDIRLPGLDGFEIFHRVRARYPDLHVILITAFGNAQDGVEGEPDRE